MMLLPMKVGPFTLERKVGTGGVVESYEGRLHVEGDRRVVVRRVLPTILRDPPRLAAVEARVRDLLGVKHPFLVSVRDWVIDGDERFVVEDWIDGVNLDVALQWCRDNGTAMPANVFLNVATQICNGLEALHGRPGKGTGSDNVLHLGLRPGAIYLTRDGKVVLGGYGLVRSPTALPQGGAPGGGAPLVEYLSPEQTHTEQKLSPASDVFGLGAVLFEMLTNQSLFRSESNLQTINKVRRAEVTTQLLRVKELIPGLDKVLYRALSLNPRHRYQRAFVLREDLRGLMAGYSFSTINDDTLAFAAPFLGADAPPAAARHSVASAPDAPHDADGFDDAPATRIDPDPMSTAAYAAQAAAERALRDQSSGEGAEATDAVIAATGAPAAAPSLDSGDRPTMPIVDDDAVDRPTWGVDLAPPTGAPMPSGAFHRLGVSDHLDDQTEGILGENTDVVEDLRDPPSSELLAAPEASADWRHAVAIPASPTATLSPLDDPPETTRDFIPSSAPTAEPDDTRGFLAAAGLGAAASAAASATPDEPRGFLAQGGPVPGVDRLSPADSDIDPNSTRGFLAGHMPAAPDAPSTEPAAAAEPPPLAAAPSSRPAAEVPPLPSELDAASKTSFRRNLPPPSPRSGAAAGPAEDADSRSPTQGPHGASASPAASRPAPSRPPPAPAPVAPLIGDDDEDVRPARGGALVGVVAIGVVALILACAGGGLLMWRQSQTGASDVADLAPTADQAAADAATAAAATAAAAAEGLATDPVPPTPTAEELGSELFADAEKLRLDREAADAANTASQSADPAPTPAVASSAPPEPTRAAPTATRAEPTTARSAPTSAASTTSSRSSTATTASTRTTTASAPTPATTRTAPASVAAPASTSRTSAAVASAPEPAPFEEVVESEATDVARYADSAARGGLGSSDVMVLEMIDLSDPAYSRSRALLLMNAQKKSDSAAAKRYLDELMMLPENRYNPIYLTDLARYHANRGSYQKALEAANLAERHWARLPSDLVFSKKTEIFEIQAAASQGLFYASGSDMELLEQTVRSWQKYRDHVNSRSRSDLAQRADGELAKLEDIKTRLQ